MTVLSSKISVAVTTSNQDNIEVLCCGQNVHRWPSYALSETTRPTDVYGYRNDCVIQLRACTSLLVDVLGRPVDQ